MALKMEFTYKQGGALSSIVFDALLSETPTLSADVTEHPVETGGNVTDNVRQKPVQLAFEGVIVDAPLPNGGRNVPSGTSGVQGYKAQQKTPEGESASQNALRELNKLWRESTLILVTTGSQLAGNVYRNMVIKNLTLTRSKDITRAIRVQIQMQQVRVVDAQQIVVNVKKSKTRQGQPKVKAGAQAKTIAPEVERVRSLSAVLGDAAASVLGF